MDSPDGRIHVGFLFENEPRFPPNIDDIKAYYLSKELLRRKVRVSWIHFEGNSRIKHDENIQFVALKVRNRLGYLRPLFMILRLLAFCLARNVNCVHVDEWLMFRRGAFWQLLLRVFLKIGNISIIFDQRDPYIDYEIAYGRLDPHSRRYKILSLQYGLIYRFTDLIILPSSVYAQLYVGSGIAPSKVLGIPRGVDTNLFKPMTGSNELRKQLGLEGKFVIGWFGMMHRYRLVNEVIIPLIKNVPRFIPKAHVLIG